MNKFMIEKINNYQKNKLPNTPKKCRFIPTCSEYAKICYQRFGFIHASYLVTKRLIKCNPFHKMSIDNPPEIKKYRHKYKTLEESLEEERLKNLIK